MKRILLAAALAFSFAPQAQAAASFSAEQRMEIESVVREFLTEKEPETIMRAVDVIKQREQQQQLAVSREAVSKNKEALFNNPNSPVLGNPKGDVTVVEFYDYACGYCKMAQAAVKDVLTTDKNVRFIAKEFPILGEGSVIAARAALASIKQKKFPEFHEVLMNHRGALSETTVMELAQRTGLDTGKLKSDMADKAVDDMIAENRKLGSELGVRGTPMFIIGDLVNPGALDATALKQAIADARAANKK